MIVFLGLFGLIINKQLKIWQWWIIDVLRLHNEFLNLKLIILKMIKEIFPVFINWTVKLYFGIFYIACPMLDPSLLCSSYYGTKLQTTTNHIPNSFRSGSAWYQYYCQWSFICVCKSFTHKWAFRMQPNSVCKLKII